MIPKGPVLGSVWAMFWDRNCGRTDYQPTFYTVHTEKTTECQGCSRRFASESAMVLQPEHANPGQTTRMFTRSLSTAIRLGGIPATMILVSTSSVQLVCSLRILSAESNRPQYLDFCTVNVNNKRLFTVPQMIEALICVPKTTCQHFKTAQSIPQSSNNCLWA